MHLLLTTGIPYRAGDGPSEYPSVMHLRAVWLLACYTSSYYQIRGVLIAALAQLLALIADIFGRKYTPFNFCKECRKSRIRMLTEP